MPMLYTPGPWCSSDRDVIVRKQGGSTWIADCRVSNGASSRAEQEANARLIASAPDLLEAADNARSILDLLLAEMPSSSLRTCAQVAHSLLVDVIAEADGRWRGAADGTDDPAGEAEANAKLIAAAPSLLALLKELVDIEGPQHGTAQWAEKVSAAIARAESP